MATAYRMADVRIGVSSGVADDMATLAKMNRNRMTVVHNPVPVRQRPSTEALSEASSQWGTAPGAKILSVGRLKEQKNHSILLHAFAQLECSNARLLILGNGPLEMQLRTLAKELGIESKVVFAGFKDDPTPYYYTADVFVLSSNYEGFGNVLVEALASGTPVVSTDCPSGPSDILADGEFGTLVPVGSADDLARAIDDVLNGSSDPNTLRHRALEFAPQFAARAYLDALGLSRPAS